MKRLIPFSLVLMSILILAGCSVTEITPGNSAAVGKSIQDKYDAVTSYNAQVYTVGSDGSMTFGNFMVEKPNKIAEIIQWETGLYLPTATVCVGAERWQWQRVANSTETVAYDCAAEVNKYFDIMEKVKEIAKYKNTITEVITTKDDAKDTIVAAPEFVDQQGRFKTLQTSPEGYKFGETVNHGGSSTYSNRHAVEVKYTNDKGENIRLLFLTENLMLLKAEIHRADGSSTTAYYSNFEINQKSAIRMLTPQEIENLRNALVK